MLNVFITVDTEVSISRQWALSRFEADFQRDIIGATAEGEFGLGFQIDVLNSYGLKAVFFVEALCASAVGSAPLRAIVSMIQDRGHEVELHVHTEWLTHMPDSLLPGRTGFNVKDFSQDEQTFLIAQGIRNLKECGVDVVRAFRAGNFGANFDTLRALRRNGVVYDSSYNVWKLGVKCSLTMPEPLIQPAQIEGVCEVPVSFFLDGWGRYRHIQLVACSSGEMESALLDAWRNGWPSFVVVSHSFELLKGRGNHRPVLPDRIVIKRFQKLCRFLAGHPDKFRTTTFSAITPQAIEASSPLRPLRVAKRHTALRLAEQLARKVL